MQRHRGAFEAAGQELLRRAGEVRRPKELSLALWGCAKAGRCDMRLVEALLQRALDDGAQLLHRANGQDHSIIWWALATLTVQQQQQQQQRQGLPTSLAEHVLCTSAQLISGDVRGQRFAPQGLANMMWAYAKLQRQHQADIFGGTQLQQHLCSEAAAQLSGAATAYTFKQQELSNMLWACATLGLADAELLQPLCREVADRLTGRTQVHTFREQELSNMLWACAALGMRGAAVLQPLCAGTAARLMDHAHTFKEQELSNMLWACATLGTRESSTLLQPLCNEAAARLADRKRAGAFMEQELSNMLWACATLGLADAALLQPLCSEAAARLADRARASAFVEQHLSNMLWSCATLGIADDALLRPLCREAAARLAQNARTCSFGDQGVSNMLWACATLGIGDDALLQPLCREAAARLRDPPGACTFQDQALSNMLWACAKLQLDYPGLVQALAQELARRLPSGKVGSQALCNSVWGVAKLGRRDLQPFLQAAAQSVVGARVRMCHPDVPPLHWASLLWGLATLRHYSPDMLRVACEWLRSPQDGRLVVQRASGQECANMLLALAHLGWYDQQLTQLLMERLAQLLHVPGQPMESQHLANSLWAAAALPLPPGTLLSGRHGPAVRALLAEAELRGVRGLNSLELTQLWQLHVELAAAGSSGDPRVSAPPGRAADPAAGAGSGFSGWLLAAARKAQMQTVTAAQRALPSQLQRDVLAHAQLLAQRRHLAAVEEVSGEHLVERGGLCLAVDVWVRMGDGREVALEVDGPSHFMANEGHTRRKVGSTQLRDRQLARVFGQPNLVCVPYWEWQALQGQEDRLRHLAALLQQGSG